MGMLGNGQLAGLMLDPDFGGLTIGGQEISREEIADLAQLDAEQARHKREVDRLDRQLLDLDPSDTSRRLTLTNLRRIAKEKHADAMGKALCECMLLGVPIHLALAKAPLHKKLDELFERSFRHRGNGNG